MVPKTSVSTAPGARPMPPLGHDFCKIPPNGPPEPPDTFAEPADGPGESPRSFAVPTTDRRGPQSRPSEGRAQPAAAEGCSTVRSTAGKVRQGRSSSGDRLRALLEAEAEGRGTAEVR